MVQGRLHSRVQTDVSSWPEIGLSKHIRKLRLLTFNIQLGIKTERYRHYITRGWQHILPAADRMNNLKKIGQMLTPFDVVALQEADGGSLRSGYINQVEYLAMVGKFPYWYQQRNRNFGPLAQHGNGFLSRYAPNLIEDHKLPGMIPGRGAIVMQLDTADRPLHVVMMHLSLGSRAQQRQLSYVAELIKELDRVVLMGDMNIPVHEMMENSPLKHTNLFSPTFHAKSFPSWDPALSLDHVLMSPDLDVVATEVLDCPFSDHLPIAVEISIPSPLSRAH